MRITELHLDVHWPMVTKRYIKAVNIIPENYSLYVSKVYSRQVCAIVIIKMELKCLRSLTCAVLMITGFMLGVPSIFAWQLLVLAKKKVAFVVHWL